MPSVTGEILHLRQRLACFEKECVQAVGELTKTHPQIGPALIHIQRAISNNDRLIQEYNHFNRIKP
jgi:hypothetical protein